MRQKLTDFLVVLLMVEGAIALTLLIGFTIYRIASGTP